MNTKNLFTLGLAGSLMLFATSCADDDTEDAPLSPRLDVTDSFSGSTGGDVSIIQGTPLTFAWDARKGASDLETFSISVSGANATVPLPTSFGGETFPYDISNANDEIYVDSIAFNSSGANLGSTTYTFTVTDGAGSSVSSEFTVTVVSGTTQLSAPVDFDWVRVGGNPAEGLSQFGLMWNNNTSTNAIVAIDNATTMVNLGSTAWTTIETQQDLNAAINSGTPITQYTGVSVVANNIYDDVLGVIHNGVNYIIHITRGTITTAPAGTTVLIEGQYKD